VIYLLCPMCLNEWVIGTHLSCGLHSIVGINIPGRLDFFFISAILFEKKKKKTGAYVLKLSEIWLT